MTQAAIYTRVSTDEQAQTGTSLATQEAACRAYCERAGWEVVAVESDEGVSGATMVRPALARVIGLAESRAIGAVVILSIDRAARNTLGWLQLQEHLRAHGCEIHAVREPADATPWGQLSSTVRSGFAQFDLTTRLTEIAAARADLQVSLSDAEALLSSSPPGLPPDLPALLEQLRESAQSWPRQEQNVLLRGAIDRIDIHADGTYTIQPGRRIPGRM